jgi:hypothetical protein
MANTSFADRRRRVSPDNCYNLRERYDLVLVDVTQQNRQGEESDIVSLT